VKRGTILVLVVLVAILLWAVREREKEREHTAGTSPQPLLFDGLRPERVQGIRIDHLERGIEVTLERDRAGVWFLTDPIAYPANGDLVSMLLNHLAQSHGALDHDPDPGALGLDPPLVVLEATEAVEDGSRRLWRVEVGSLDLDSRLVHVRVPGHPHAPAGAEAAVLRVPRTLYTTLERNPDDYRDDRATPLVGRQVVSVSRRGHLEGGRYGEVDLTFDARRTGEVWRRTDTPLVRLDPSAVGWVAAGAANLRVTGFVDDSPRDLSRYGLEDPRMTIELTTDRGQTVELRFGLVSPEGGGDPELDPWFAMREGFPHVWRVRGQDVHLLTTPGELLVDTRILRAHRENVLRVSLEGAGGSLRIDLEEGGWWVGEADGSARWPADRGAVEDLLAILERAELGDLPADLETPDGGEASITVLTRTGDRFGGEVAGPWYDPATGMGGRLFRRHGDEMWQLASEEVAGLCETPVDELRSTRVLDVDEFLVDRVRITRGEATHVYLRRDREWFEGTSRVAAPIETQVLIGNLFHLAASEWLSPEAPWGVGEKVAIELHGRFPEGQLAYALASDAGGSTICFLASGEAARLEGDGALFDAVGALFR